MVKLRVFVLLSFIFASSAVSFKVKAGYETFFCDGDFSCDAGGHVAVCNGTSAIYPSSSSSVDVSWDVEKIIVANLAAPVIKSWVFDPLLDHIILPSFKWFGNKVRVYRKIASEEPNIEETFLSSLNLQGIKQLELINNVLTREEEWYTEPIIFNENSENYVVGYQYTGGRGNHLYEIKIVGGFDSTAGNAGASYYKLKKNRVPLSYAIPCHPKENLIHPYIHPLPLIPTPLGQFTVAGTPENTFINSFTNSVARRTANAFNHLLMSPNIAEHHYLANGTHDNYGSVGERVYMLFNPLPNTGGIFQNASYITIESKT